MSGGFNPVNLISQVALGALTGGASLYAQLATQLISTVGQQVLQQVGEKLGLPQSTIDMAQGAFAGATGDPQGASRNLSEAVESYGDLFNANPADVGNAERELNDIIDQISTDLAESSEAKEARQSGGKSWLMSLAQALGKVADKLAAEMEEMSQTLGQGENKASQNIEFGAKAQEFAQFFQSANNVIKTLGEALSAGARKQ